MPNIGSTGGAIPAGGTSGQVLSKNTSTDYDASWVAASAGGGQMSWAGGRWFTTGLDRVNAGPVALASAAVYFVPIYVPNACTISRVGQYVAATAASIKLGLYTDGGSSLASLGPSTQIGTQYAGALTVSAVNSMTVSGWVIPSAGLYWVYYTLSASAPVECSYGTMPFHPTASGSAPPGQSLYSYLQSTPYVYSSTVPASVGASACTPTSSWMPYLLFYV